MLTIKTCSFEEPMNGDINVSDIIPEKPMGRDLAEHFRVLHKRCFYPPDSGRDGLLFDDFKIAESAGFLNVRTAANLTTENDAGFFVDNGVNLYRIRVLFAEDPNGADVSCFLKRHFLARNREIL